MITRKSNEVLEIRVLLLKLKNSSGIDSDRGQNTMYDDMVKATRNSNGFSDRADVVPESHEAFAN